MKNNIIKAKPLPLCRWWLRTRPCSLGIQLGPEEMLPCMEFYVPWWGWPFELLYRIIFGRNKLEKV